MRHPSIKLSVPRGFEYVFTGKLRHDQLMPELDAVILARTHANQTKRRYARVERQRERENERINVAQMTASAVCSLVLRLCLTKIAMGHVRLSIYCNIE